MVKKRNAFDLKNVDKTVGSKIPLSWKYFSTYSRKYFLERSSASRCILRHMAITVRYAQCASMCEVKIPAYTRVSLCFKLWRHTLFVYAEFELNECNGRFALKPVGYFFAASISHRCIACDNGTLRLVAVWRMRSGMHTSLKIHNDVRFRIVTPQTRWRVALFVRHRCAHIRECNL